MADLFAFASECCPDSFLPCHTEIARSSATHQRYVGLCHRCFILSPLPTSDAIAAQTLMRAPTLRRALSFALGRTCTETIDIVAIASCPSWGLGLRHRTGYSLGRVIFPGSSGGEPNHGRLKNKEPRHGKGQGLAEFEVLGETLPGSSHTLICAHSHLSEGTQKRP